MRIIGGAAASSESESFAYDTPAPYSIPNPAEGAGLGTCESDSLDE